MLISFCFREGNSRFAFFETVFIHFEHFRIFPQHQLDYLWIDSCTDDDHFHIKTSSTSPRTFKHFHNAIRARIVNRLAKELAKTRGI